MEYNIYCDESCHLEHDGNDIMVLGGIRCEKEISKQINDEIIGIKERFGYNARDEIKWTKVSNSNVDFFNSLIDYFFEKDELSFRGYIGRGKTELAHDDYKQSYNDWYYKMYYRMLEFLIDRDRKSTYFIYLDIKDTIGKEKINRLKALLNKHFHNIIKNIQLVRSHEVALVQLTDLLIGAISYKNRGIKTSEAKLKVIDHIEELSGHSLLQTVSKQYEKANWFVWTPKTWR